MLKFHMIEDYVAGHYATTCVHMNPVDAARQVFKFRNEYRRLLEEELKKKRKKEEEEEKKRKEEEKKARVARVKKEIRELRAYAKKHKLTDEEKKFIEFEKKIEGMKKGELNCNSNYVKNDIDRRVEFRTNVLSVPCPKCSSGIGEPCRYISGAATSDPHAARMRHHAALWGKKG